MTAGFWQVTDYLAEKLPSRKLRRMRPDFNAQRPVLHLQNAHNAKKKPLQRTCTTANLSGLILPQRRDIARYVSATLLICASLSLAASSIPPPSSSVHCRTIRFLKVCVWRFRKKSVEHYPARLILICMVPRHATLHPWLRAFGAATLLLWVSAWILCAVACSAGNSPRRPCCHRESSPDSHHGSEGSHSGCLAHKLLLPAPDHRVDLKPGFICVSLRVEVPAHFAIEPPCALLFPRQSPGREFPLTPLVCLDPSFRSLPPPVFA
jgi:hypothetical protein